MTVNLIKLCVGIEDIEHLEQVQKKRRNKDGNCYHRTRMTPTRGKEIVGQGSMYWVIKGFIQVRQEIVGLSKGKREDGRPACVIELDPKLIPVQITAHRPFQGWRYLKPEAAPPDLKGKGRKAVIDPTMPKEMRLELAKLGLL
ncbi:MAG: DUF1489 domain-containing protein [Rhodospirillaceae bacterium]|nr:DUF1489 domain-containing protein [Rhodospirillaceae bacterium]